MANHGDLPEQGKDEIRAAIDVILKLWDYRNTKLALALEQLDRAADEIARLENALQIERERCATIAHNYLTGCWQVGDHVAADVARAIRIHASGNPA